MAPARSYARLTRITRPEGNYVNFTYDPRGNVTEVRQVAKPGSGTPDLVTTALFPATCDNVKTCNQPTRITDPRGNATDYTYGSGHGQVLTITGPAPVSAGARPQQRFTYNFQQALVKDANGATVGAGALIQLPGTVSQCHTGSTCALADEIRSGIFYTTTAPTNLQPESVFSGNSSGPVLAQTSFTYDPIGNVVTVNGPLAGADDTTTAIYDSKRRVIGTISPDPDGAGSRSRVAQRQTFAINGDLTKTEVGSVTGTTLADLQAMTVVQGVDNLYDADGRKVRETLTGGGSSHAVTQYSYDSEGRVTCAAQRMNPAAWGSLPASACTLGTEGSQGPDRINRSIRDPNGRVTQLQVAVGTSIQANERTLGYSANGVVTHLVDANNNRTTYEHDGHDRLTKTRFPVTAIGQNASSTTDYEQLTLDASGNVTQRRLRDGQAIGYTYDALNRLTAKNLPGTEPDATYAYDLVGRMTGATQSGITISLTWDALHRLTSETSPQGTARSFYDLAGRRTQLDLPGPTTGPDRLYATYAYDLLGNVTQIRENGATSGVGVLATYGYDQFGRRASVTFGNGAVTNYAYDNAARLQSHTLDLAGTANDLTQTFSHNPASQIASVTRSNDLYAWTGAANENVSSTPNGLNQLTNVGPKTITHDARGNVTAIGSDAYGYSSENFLTSGPGTSLSYDPLGRLSQVAQGFSSTRLGYDRLDRIAEYSASSVIQRRYIHAPGIDQPIVWYEGSGTTNRRFLAADERGSIIAVTDSSGAILARNAYDEYGRPQSTNLGKFGYTGQARIPEIKVWYYKARIYNDELGRFLQTDPIGYAAGPNLYSYVRNDPVNRTDPLGLQDVPTNDPGACEQDPHCEIVTGTRCRDSYCASYLPGAFFFLDFFTGPDRSPWDGERPALGLDDVQRVPCNPTPEDLENSGAVTFRGVSGSLFGIVGYSLTGGQFTTTSGLAGDFAGSAWGFGLGPSFSVTGGTDASLASFMGGSDNINFGAFGIEASFSKNIIGGSWRFSSTSWGTDFGFARIAGSALKAPTAALSISISVTFAVTEITNVTCTVESQ